MANAPTLIPDDIAQIVTQRDAVWRQFDQMQAQGRKLEELGRKLSTTPNVQPVPLSPLANAQDPPSELNAAINQLTTIIADMERLRSNITSNQAEIARLQQQKVQWMIAAVVIVVIIVLIIAL